MATIQKQITVAGDFTFTKWNKSRNYEVYIKGIDKQIMFTESDIYEILDKSNSVDYDFGVIFANVGEMVFIIHAMQDN